MAQGYVYDAGGQGSAAAPWRTIQAGDLPGGGAGGLAQLFDSTLAVDTAALDTGANGIASGHGSLYVVGIFRTTEATNFSDATLTVNGDTGANYDYNYMQVVQTTVQGGIGNGVTSVKWTVPATLEASGVFSSAQLIIPAYDQTTAHKTGQLFSGQADTSPGQCFIRHLTFTWRSTVAVNRLTVTAPGTNKLLAGSRLTVYGTV